MKLGSYHTQLNCIVIYFVRASLPLVIVGGRPGTSPACSLTTVSKVISTTSQLLWVFSSHPPATVHPPPDHSVHGHLPHPPAILLTFLLTTGPRSSPPPLPATAHLPFCPQVHDLNHQLLFTFLLITVSTVYSPTP